LIFKMIKMSIIKNLGIFILFVFAFQSCMSPLTEKDNGRAIELQDESDFEINLQAAKGETWKLESYNHELIQTHKQTITETTDDSGNTVNEFNFTFSTHGSGQSVVKLVCVDNNDQQNIPHKIFKVKIICGTMGRIESD